MKNEMKKQNNLSFWVELCCFIVQCLREWQIILHVEVSFYAFAGCELRDGVGITECSSCT